MTKDPSIRSSGRGGSGNSLGIVLDQCSQIRKYVHVTMLNLEYGSDEDSDVETVQAQAETLGFASPPNPIKEPASVNRSVKGGGLQLPPPTNKSSRRKDGPVKIKIDVLDPTVDEVESVPVSKKPRTEIPSAHRAGSSSLVSMLSKLPAPKVVTLAPQPARVLGGGVKSFDDPGLLIDSSRLDGSVPSLTIPKAEAGGGQDSSASVTCFMPSSLGKPKSKPTSINPLPPSLEPKASSTLPKSQSSPTAQPNASAPAVDFFSLGMVCFLHKQL
jgi:hypothetical protein